MTQFMVIYDRATGRASITSFDGDDAAEQAMRARMLAEVTAGPTEEVTTLTAASVSELRANHARYFQGASEMLDDLQHLAAS